jgi:hypothetical protein
MEEWKKPSVVSSMEYAQAELKLNSARVHPAAAPTSSSVFRATLNR